MSVLLLLTSALQPSAEVWQVAASLDGLPGLVTGSDVQIPV